MWWLVTPGNPLKDTRGLQPLEQRMAAARALASHPRIDVTGLEAVINTRYTYDTLEFLVRRCPGVRFVWVMGADNLRSFSRWQNWRGIANLHAHGGGGPHGIEPLRHRRPRAPRRSPATACRSGWPRSLADRDAAGLGLSPRPEIAPVLDRAPRAADENGGRLKSAGAACLS